MTVGTALSLISQVSAEVLDEFVGDLDKETRWAMTWFKDHGFEPGTYDDAEKLFKRTDTSLGGVDPGRDRHRGQGQGRPHAARQAA